MFLLDLLLRLQLRLLAEAAVVLQWLMEVLPKVTAETLEFGEQQMFGKVAELLLPVLSQKIVPNLRASAELASRLMPVAQGVQLVLKLMMQAWEGALWALTLVRS